MRGLVKATALWLTPALAWASLVDVKGALETLETVPSAFVTLEVPVRENVVEALTFRFDVEQADGICDYANVKINGQPLPRNGDGAGHGSLTLEYDTVIGANWAFECVQPGPEPLQQLMTFTVETIDGNLVPEVTFSASFRQVFPVSISKIDGAADVHRLRVAVSPEGGIPIDGEDVADEAKDEGEDDDEDWTESNGLDGHGTDGRPQHHDASKDMPEPEDELAAELRELQLLRVQAHELHELIRFKEFSIMERFSDKLPPPPPHGPGSFRQCDNIRCVIHAIKERVRHSAGRLCGSMLGHHGPHGPPRGPPHRPPHRPPHGPPSHHGNSSCHCPPPPFDGPHHPPPGHGPPPFDRPHHPPPGHGPPPPFPFDNYVPPKGSFHDKGPEREESVMKDDFHMPPADHEEPHHPPQHAPGQPPHHPPPPPEEDPFLLIIGMAAIALGLFSLFGIGFMHRRLARKGAHEHRHSRRSCRRSREARRARRQAGQQSFRSVIRSIFFGRDANADADEKEAMLSGRCESDDETSMEQEIAQLRQAASIVEGMVAAEEGRSQRAMVQHATPAIVCQHAYPVFGLNPEALPDYDDEMTASSVVADGCRYTPGSSDYTPSNNGSNASDVLGDTKN